MTNKYEIGFSSWHYGIYIFPIKFNDEFPHGVCLFIDDEFIHIKVAIGGMFVENIQDNEKAEVVKAIREIQKRYSGSLPSKELSDLLNKRKIALN